MINEDFRKMVHNLSGAKLTTTELKICMRLLYEALGNDDNNFYLTEKNLADMMGLQKCQVYKALVELRLQNIVEKFETESQIVYRFKEVSEWTPLPQNEYIKFE